MQKLIQGIHQFREEDFRPLQTLFEELAKGQNPETLFITCSDSRIDPNLLTRSKPGELFILRNAGNIIPPHSDAGGGEGATIELAVAGLGVKDVIVCGHSHCGAMQGLLHPERVATMPAVPKGDATVCLTLSWSDYYSLIQARSTATPQDFEIARRLGVIEGSRNLFDGYLDFAHMDENLRENIAGITNIDENGVHWRLFGRMDRNWYFKQGVRNFPADILSGISDALDEIPLTGPVTEAQYRRYHTRFMSAFAGKMLRWPLRLGCQQ